jgi:hypothetical protein
MKTLIALSVLLVLAAPAAAQLELHGFVEAAGGVRLQDPSDPPGYWPEPREDFPLPPVWDSPQDFSLLESRLQLRGDLYGDAGDAHFALDFLNDQVSDQGVDVIIREAWAKFATFDNHLEVRAGRQPTTWGTGDLLFINDLFPKDWVSFFVGREEQYLKNPVDAARFGIFGLPFNIDVVYVPEFTPDNLPSGERLAFWLPALAPIEPVESELGNGELSIRLNRYVGSWNWSAYGYVGRWKQPLGAKPNPSPSSQEDLLARYYYPELNVWGASTRGGLFGGVAWLEGGYYDSREDSSGDDPFVPNSEVRGMVGYERQWFTDFTGGAQFYAEYMMNFDEATAARQAAIDAGASGGLGNRDDLEDQFFLKDELRTLVTVNLRKQWLYQTLTTSAFVYFSPSDVDSYTRLVVSYALNDDVTLTAGANLFTADDPRTQFGMNDSNDNVYARIRYGF